MADIRSNTRGSAPPQVTDDAGAGYGVGSLWFYGGHAWRCISAEKNAARWSMVSGIPQAWRPGERILPANFVSAGAKTLDTKSDRLVLFPFEVGSDVQVASAVVHVAKETDGGARLDIGIYAHDWVTGRPYHRITRGSGLNAETVGSKFLPFASPADLSAGLYWVGVGIKGVAAPAEMVCLTGSNGRHLGGATMSDFGAGDVAACLTAAYDYADGLPSPLPALVQAGSGNAVLVGLRRS